MRWIAAGRPRNIGEVRSLCGVLLVALVGWANPAGAEAPRPRLIEIPVLEPTAALSSKLVFLHRCPITGCMVNPGTDDSRTDTSALAPGPRTIGQFTRGDAVWNAVVDCVRATYAPFDISITDVDPGTVVPHFEHMVGGHPLDLRSDLEGAGGVAPFTCSEVPNAISFTFDVWGPDVNVICWTAAQEIAHAFGLDHEMNAKDPMTYLDGSLPKRFQATDSPCGENENRLCRCGGATQNSYQQLVGIFGPGVPTAPTIEIKSPVDGQEVQPGFTVRLLATDDVAVEHVELWIDGANTGITSDKDPFWVSAPELASGPHTVEIHGFDLQGTPGSTAISVELGPPCTADDGCAGTSVCVMAQCVPGPEVAGGLGDSCQANTECLSLQCVSDTSNHRACVESCDLSPGSCPDGFSCLSGPTGGVCWTTDDGGCCSASGSPTGPALLSGWVLTILVIRRKRRTRAP